MNCTLPKSSLTHFSKSGRTHGKYIILSREILRSVSKKGLLFDIYMTYLKRRISFAEGSVGGPVDVAVISKGDEFVWIKRKHNFNKELN